MKKKLIAIIMLVTIMFSNFNMTASAMYEWIVQDGDNDWVIARLLNRVSRDFISYAEDNKILPTVNALHDLNDVDWNNLQIGQSLNTPASEAWKTAERKKQNKIRQDQETERIESQRRIEAEHQAELRRIENQRRIDAEHQAEVQRQKQEAERKAAELERIENQRRIDAEKLVEANHQKRLNKIAEDGKREFEDYLRKERENTDNQLKENAKQSEAKYQADLKKLQEEQKKSDNEIQQLKNTITKEKDQEAKIEIEIQNSIKTVHGHAKQQQDQTKKLEEIKNQINNEIEDSLTNLSRQTKEAKTKITRIEQQTEAVEYSLTRIEQQTEELENRVMRLGQQTEDAENSITSIEKQTEEVKNRVTRLEQQTEELENTLTSLLQQTKDTKAQAQEYMRKKREKAAEAKRAAEAQKLLEADKFKSQDIHSISVKDNPNLVKKPVDDKFKKPEEAKGVTNNDPTTIDAMVAFDPANKDYAPFVKQISDAIEPSAYNYSSDKSPSGLLRDRITHVCRKIYHSEKVVERNRLKLAPTEVVDEKDLRTKPTDVQLLTIFRVAYNILYNNGSLAEVKTGEGKSLIIDILAIVLRQYGRTIDIVTSTVELAKRGQEEQQFYCDLFKDDAEYKDINMESGFLYNENDLHQNGVRNTTEDAEHFLKGFNTEVLRKPIVYSTNFNFQFIYLYGLFSKSHIRGPADIFPIITRPYDVVIVDEVDNMFLDQSMSPAIISRSILINNIEEIFKIVYSMVETASKNNTIADLDVNQIIAKLEVAFPNCKDFKKDGVQMLKDAALLACKYQPKKEYVVDEAGKKITIIDDSTSCLRPGSRWQNFIHEMLEIRHFGKIQSPSVAYCAITQKSYFNLYSCISGLTGTIGSEEDRKLLKASYKDINMFEVLPNKLSKRTRLDKDGPETPENHEGLNEMINVEIQETKLQGRPVLLILTSIQQVEEFCKKYNFPIDQTIQGVDLDQDRIAVARAGEAGVVTIATNAAGRGTDIHLSKESRDNGGLHVIIAYMPENERILNQAIGRSARRNDPGSVTVYHSKDDFFYEAPDFEEGYDHLFNLQKEFEDYVKAHWKWLYEGDNQYTPSNATFPFQASPEKVLEILAAEINNNFNADPSAYQSVEITTKGFGALKTYIFNMIITSWGTFFSDISANIEPNKDKDTCDQKYKTFLDKLHEWMPEDCKDEQKALEKIVSRLNVGFSNDLNSIENSERNGWLEIIRLPEPEPEITYDMACELFRYASLESKGNKLFINFSEDGLKEFLQNLALNQGQQQTRSAHNYSPQELAQIANQFIFSGYHNWESNFKVTGTTMQANNMGAFVGLLNTGVGLVEGSLNFIFNPAGMLKNLVHNLNPATLMNSMQSKWQMLLDCDDFTRGKFVGQVGGEAMLWCGPGKLIKMCKGAGAVQVGAKIEGLAGRLEQFSKPRGLKVNIQLFARKSEIKMLNLASPGEDLFVGTYNQVRRANLKSGLNATHTPHHAVQNAVSQTTHGKGITINIKKEIHELTETMRRTRNLLEPRQHLAADLFELRNLLKNANYDRNIINRQLQELSEKNKLLGGFEK